jgi:hypothetical protein
LFAATEQAKLRNAVRLGPLFDLPLAQMALNSIGLNWPHGKSNIEYKGIVWGEKRTSKPGMRNHKVLYFLGEFYIFLFVFQFLMNLPFILVLRAFTLALDEVRILITYTSYTLTY